MDKFSRKQQMLQLLKHRKGFVALRDLAQHFACSERNIRRDIKSLRADGYDIYNKAGVGYKLNTTTGMEVPGMWFSPEELYALLTVRRLGESISGGMFDMQPVQDKIRQLLGKSHPNVSEMRRIRVLGTGSRCKHMLCFSAVTQALLSRHQLQIVYHGRQKNTETSRRVSPQRMVFYRGNWYLDAWCHGAKGLRSFAVEQIKRAEDLGKPCKHISDEKLDAELARAFGIFSGKPLQTAVLRFTAHAARWVEQEEWFPDKRGEYLQDGSFELQIPYNNPTELIMEICRYGDQVEVVAPDDLRRQVAEVLRRAAAQYR